ncbi:DUF938 domain-containing protein [Tepidamorphus sp. 3E244]|uniref:DUF938 domain-containing protein n=1 Tax=Tepidamorphus sp. 3E244 TaxID=3385498 RepID=UPI0038FC94C6
MSEYSNKPQPFIIREQSGGARLNAPSAQRNEAPILGELARLFGDAGITSGPARALELASGTGQHSVAFAREFPGIHWQPSDVDDGALASIAAWRAEAALPNLAQPIRLDLTSPVWGVEIDGRLDAIVAVNLLHISPGEVTRNVLAGAQRLLAPGGLMFVYGCFRRDGDWVSDSNRAFDDSLKSRDERWGLRDTADVTDEAARHGLKVDEAIAMPANNTAMVFTHQSPSSS